MNNPLPPPMPPPRPALASQAPPPLGPLPQPAPPSQAGGLSKLKENVRDVVLIVAGIVAIVFAIVYGISALRETLAAKRDAPKPGALTYSAYTDADAAHITFTNASGAALFQCAKGVVTNTKTGQKVESVTVCSGDLGPHASLALEAPYPRYALQSVCGGQPDARGTRYVEWSRCAFSVSTIDAAPVGPAPLGSAASVGAPGLPPEYSLDAGVPPLSPRAPLRAAPRSAINTQILARTKSDDPVKVTNIEVSDGYNGKSVKVEMTSTLAAPPDKPSADEKAAAENKTITVVKGYVYGFDAFDEPTSMSGSEFVIQVYADDMGITPGKSDSKTWRIGYGVTASNAAVEITKVKFKDGTVWERPE